ncbi:unnamed protein product [Brassica rapa subsp. narinosa]
MFAHGSFLLLPLKLFALSIFASDQFDELLVFRSLETLVDLWAWSGYFGGVQGFTCVRCPSASLIKVRFQALWFSCDVVAVPQPVWSGSATV